MNTQDYVESLGLSEGQSKRMACPTCGKAGTFSVTHEHGGYKWNCFHADCEERGRTGERLTREKAAGLFTAIPDGKPAVPFEKPKSWSRTLPPRASDYLHTVHTSGRYDDIYYDVQRDRVVYAIRDEDNKLVDGVGRTVVGAKPKWYRYGNYPSGFRIGTSDTAFVVEDVPSAVSISDWATGYALLGTSLRDEHIKDLVRFKQVVVALDKDATDKALTYMRALNTIVPTGILMLDQDLKSMGEQEREHTIRNSIARK
jgi:hypothetical protein